jgi:oligoendopeptidase F
MNLFNSSFPPPPHLPPKPPALLISSEGLLKPWLDQLEARLEKVAVGYNSSSFNIYIGRPAPDLSQFDTAFSALLLDPAHQQTINFWREKATDPVLRRRLELFRRTFIEAEVSKAAKISEARNHINDQLIKYQPQVGSEKLTRSDITEILRTNPDRQRRRQVYEQALSPLSSRLAPQVTGLLKLRNAEARRMGYPTYADLHLELLGLNRASLFGLFDRLAALTEAPYRAFLEKSQQELGLDRVEPWDLHWLADHKATLPETAFQRANILPLVHDLLAWFGLQPAALPIELVTKDIPFGGLCFTIKVPDDIRIVSNPRDGYPSYRTLVHEFGHGIHAAYNRQSYFTFKRESGIFNEGMAETLAYFTHYPEWLTALTGLNQAQVCQYRQENNNRRILRLRNLLAQARFEIEAYDKPEADLDRLLAEYEAHYLRLPLNLTPRWAANSFPTTHPIYRQNYILADLIAAQTHAALNRRFGPFFSLTPPERAGVFNFLRDNYFAPGNSLEWTGRVQQATGQPLSPNDLIAELGL